MADRLMAPARAFATSLLPTTVALAQYLLLFHNSGKESIQVAL